MKDETLLPCPFCGGKAEFDYDEDGLNWVSCSTCGVSTDTAYHTDVDARETLRDVWNSRALQSANSAQTVTVPEKLPLDYLQGQKDGLEWAAQMAEASHPQTGDWLYDDPIELAKAIRKGPDMPNHDNTLVIPDGLIPAINRLLDSDGSRGRYSAIQCYDAREEVERLLAAAPKIPDAPKAKNVIGHYQGADGKEQDIITLTAKNGDSKCWCRTCRPVTLTDTRFVVCPDCGNKRCPKANDHRNACTGSNEPGQPGSAYPDAPKV